MTRRNLFTTLASAFAPRPQIDTSPGPSVPRDLEDLAALERQMIVNALKRFDGNQTRAARWLGMSRRALLYRMQRHGIAVARAAPAQGPQSCSSNCQTNLS